MKRYICQDCGHQIIAAQKPSACEVCSSTILLPFEGKKPLKPQSDKPRTMIDVTGFGVKKNLPMSSPQPLPPLPPPSPPTQSPTQPSRYSRPSSHQPSRSSSSQPSSPSPQPIDSRSSKKTHYTPGSFDSAMMNIAAKPSIHLDSSLLSSYNQPISSYQNPQRRPKKSFPVKRLILGCLGIVLLGLLGYFINYWKAPLINTKIFDKVILNDHFGAAKKWSLTKGARIKNGGLFHQQPHVHHYGKSIWTGYKFTNVDVAVDTRKVNGPDNVPYGILTRLGGKNYENFYYLFIQGNGTWTMGKHHNGRWEKQRKWSKNKVINRGNKEINQLRIVCKDDLVIGYINGKRVGHFRDKSFQSGYVALTSFRGGGNAVAVYFDNIIATIENKPANSPKK